MAEDGTMPGATLVDSNSDVLSFDAKGLGIGLPAYEQPLRLFLNGKIALKAAIGRITYA